MYVWYSSTYRHTCTHAKRTDRQRNEMKCSSNERKVASSFNTKAVASFSTSGSSALIRSRAHISVRVCVCVCDCVQVCIYDSHLPHQDECAKSGLASCLHFDYWWCCCYWCGFLFLLNFYHLKISFSLFFPHSLVSLAFSSSFFFFLCVAFYHYISL